MREIKSLPSQFVKSVEDRTVSGIFSVYGNVDLVGDIVWPGAFNKTLQEAGKSALFLWQHDADSPPIAVINSYKDLTREDLPPEVLQKAPQALGGMQVTRTYLDTPRGNEVLAAIHAGSPLQASFAYDALKYDFTESGAEKGAGTQVRNLRELKLYEVSDVNWGANDATIAAGKAFLDFEFLMKELDAHLLAIKAGARHSSADMAMLNSIHDAAVGLGADNCMGMVSDGKAISHADVEQPQKEGEAEEREEEEEEANMQKSRAAAMALTLAKARRKFQLLELELSITN